MGNTISKEPESKSLDWKSLNDDLQINQKYLSSDSKLLIEKLTLNLQPVSEESPDNIDNIFSKFSQSHNNLIGGNNLVGDNNLVGGNQFSGFYNEQLGGNNSEDLSDTSPFISSEMYNILMKDNKPQTGGGEIEGDDSSTSATSSSGDLKKKKINKKNYKGKTDSNETTPVENATEETTAQEKSVHTDEEESNNKSQISYESSTAHDESNESKSEESSENKSEESSENKSAESKQDSKAKKGKKGKKGKKEKEEKGEESSIINENSNLPPSSIRTSDINMITEKS